MIRRTPPHQSLLARLMYLTGLWTIVPAGMLSVLAMSSDRWWLADLFVHFRIQFLVIGLIGMPLMLLLRRPKVAGIAAIAIVFNVVPVKQYFFDGDATANHSTSAHAVAAGQRFRIAGANVFYRNRNYAGVCRWIKQYSPDVLVLVEATERWAKQLKICAPSYSYQRLIAIPGRSGKLILSRWPVANIRLLHTASDRSPAPVLSINVRNQIVRVAGIHTIWPMGRAFASARDDELASLAKAAKTQTPFVALGDFNISPFSSVFSRLLSDGMLKRASQGRGWLPTWPAFIPIAGIQIDHILVSADITVTHFETGSGIGSDHRWVLADLMLPKP